MKVVIEIPDFIYDTLIETGKYGFYRFDAKRAIKDGIPLPKGHGRILDEKDILDIENNDGGWYDLVDMPEYIAGVKPIIEADNGESEESE